MSHPTTPDATGHRARLRSRFAQFPTSLSEVERLELLLTFAIPRKNLAPLAQELIAHFGSLRAVLKSSREHLLKIDGVGEQTALFLALIGQMADPASAGDYPQQPSLLPEEEGTPSPTDEEPAIGRPVASEEEESPVESADPRLRTFANDEIANSLALLPEAPRFADADAFRDFLRRRLPYNSESTRRRRAHYIIDRFCPDPHSYQALSHFLAQTDRSPQALGEVVFYHILSAEPLAARVAEECIWPALPLGRVEREEMRRYILSLLPELSKSSQANALRSLFNTYHLCGVAQETGPSLLLRTRSGALDSFVYILLAHFPTPGIYSFAALERGAPGRWLLWDHDWIHRQLYNLRDLGLLAKVSEIDSVRQFTLAVDRMTGLQHFFALPQSQRLNLREGPNGAT